MGRLADKTKEELIKIRQNYVGKYIGDFKKPSNYKTQLLVLDRLIRAKSETYLR